jgi:hypothetical protein
MLPQSYSHEWYHSLQFCSKTAMHLFNDPASATGKPLLYQFPQASIHTAKPKFGSPSTATSKSPTFQLYDQKPTFGV